MKKIIGAVNMAVIIFLAIYMVLSVYGVQMLAAGEMRKILTALVISGAAGILLAMLVPFSLTTILRITTQARERWRIRNGRSRNQK